MAKKLNIYTNWQQVPLILTLTQVTYLLNVSREQARKLLAAGIIPAKKVGAEWRVEKSSLLEYLGVSA